MLAMNDELVVKQPVETYLNVSRSELENMGKNESVQDSVLRYEIRSQEFTNTKKRKPLDSGVC
jgi:hypothetical protein